MTQQLELLNNESHKNLLIRADAGVPHPNFVMVVIGEFPKAASSCPIFFAKDAATGEFYAAALFGFQAGEILADSAERGRPISIRSNFSARASSRLSRISRSTLPIHDSARQRHWRCSKRTEGRATRSARYNA